MQTLWLALGGIWVSKKVSLIHYQAGIIMCNIFLIQSCMCNMPTTLPISLYCHPVVDAASGIESQPKPNSTTAQPLDTFAPLEKCDLVGKCDHPLGRPPSNLWLRTLLREDVLHGNYRQAPSLRTYVVKIGNLYYEVRVKWDGMEVCPGIEAG